MISAVIIANNEEQYILNCIQSLMPVADEIIVADTGSTDNTINIAKQAGAKVLNLNWTGYADTKNTANQMAKYPYILSLDADEQLSTAAQQEISKVKENLNGVYEFKRLNHYAKKPIKTGGWYPDMKIRLFPKHIIWEGEVHERLNIKDLKITYFDADILHFTYKNSQEHKAKIKKYAHLAARDLKNKSKGSLLISLLVSPPSRFIKSYFLKKGFTSGKYGFFIAHYGAMENFRKYWIALLSK